MRSIDEALDAVRGAKTPDDLIDLALAERPVRNSAIVPALLAEGERDPNPFVRERRLAQAQLLARVHRAVDAVVSSVTSTDWLRLATSESLVYDPRFAGLVWVFARDARDEGNNDRARALRSALRIRSRLRGAMFAVRKLRELDHTERMHAFETDPRLRDPAVHRWLAAYVQHLTRMGGDSAAPWAWLYEAILETDRLLAAAAAIPSSTRSVGKRRQFAIPATVATAEYWYLCSEHLNAPFDTLAQRVADGLMTLDAALAEALALAEPRDAQESVYYASYFLEHAARSKVDAESLLARYRDLLTVDAPPDYASTRALRYGVLVNFLWRSLTAPARWLLDAADRLVAATAQTSDQKYPRLARDLRFTRARLLENAATFAPQHLPIARAEYEAGLAILSLSHEQEPRGRALSDLANVYSRLASRATAETDTAVLLALTEGAFEQALVCLSDRFPTSRAVALLNFSIFLMEQAAGTELAIERAWALVEEARQLMEHNLTDARSHDLLASIHLARGNVLRKRTLGAPSQRLLDANECFHSGLHLATEGSDLYGLLRLNQGQVHRELFELTGDKAHLSHADRALTAAAEALRDRPLHEALALFELAALDPLIGTTTPDDVIARARTAVEKLERFGATRELAFRQYQFARLLPLGDGERATLLLEALAHYRDLGDLEHVVLVAQSIADADVLEFTSSGDAAPLKRTSALLTEAAMAAESIRAMSPTMAWKLGTGALLSVHADLAWVESHCGVPAPTLLWRMSLLQNRELLDTTAHHRARGTANSADTAAVHDIRHRARRIEMNLWRLDAEAGLHRNAFTVVREAHEDLAVLRDEEGLLAGSIDVPTVDQLALRVARFFAVFPDALIVDIGVTRWGSLLLLVDRDGTVVERMPLTRFDMESQLNGSGAGSGGWLGARQAWVQTSIGHAEASRTFSEETQKVLGLLERDLLAPVVRRLDQQARPIFVIPGALAGLPLHAIPGFINRARFVTYAPTVARLPENALPPPFQGEVLCVLCDGERAPGRQLPYSPTEVADLATRLARAGVKVTVCASVGENVGKQVAALAGLEAEGVQIEQVRPTRAWFAANAPSATAIFYSGHGVPDALLLVDDSGEHDRLTLEDVLAMPHLESRPLIHLSACSTSDEQGRAASEMLSFASCLVRLGASVVTAGLWELSDRLSSRVTSVFAEEVLRGALVPDAYEGAVARIRTEEVHQWAPFIMVVGP